MFCKYKHTPNEREQFFHIQVRQCGCFMEEFNFEKFSVIAILPYTSTLYKMECTSYLFHCNVTVNVINKVVKNNRMFTLNANSVRS